MAIREEDVSSYHLIMCFPSPSGETPGGRFQKPRRYRLAVIDFYIFSASARDHDETELKNIRGHTPRLFWQKILSRDLSRPFREAGPRPRARNWPFANDLYGGGKNEK